MPGRRGAGRRRVSHHERDFRETSHRAQAADQLVVKLMTALAVAATGGVTPHAVAAAAAVLTGPPLRRLRATRRGNLARIVVVNAAASKQADERRVTRLLQVADAAAPAEGALKAAAGVAKPRQATATPPNVTSDSCLCSVRLTTKSIAALIGDAYRPVGLSLGTSTYIFRRAIDAIL